MTQLIKENFDLKPLNSFGIAARANCFASVRDMNELHAALDHASQHGLPVQVLGGGSNVLFTSDFPGLVLQMNFRGITLRNNPGEITAAAGENWHEFVKYCLQNHLYGIENLALIPGTVGAAPIQNIGAYGVELEQFVAWVEVCDITTGEIRKVAKQECQFSYRDSIFKTGNSPSTLVLSVTLQLLTTPAPNTSYQALQEALDTEGPGAASATPQQVFDTVCRVRRSKLPDPAVLGNAGSFFKNPIIPLTKFQFLREIYAAMPCYQTEDPRFVKVPAAWLLDQLGWKGRQRGRAAVHANHALVLVNLGQARGDEIWSLAQEMRSSVVAHFGVTLETEVRII